MKTILTDCDGVLLDWDKDFKIWMKNNGYTLRKRDCYEISERYHISHDKALECVKDFNASPIVGALSPQDDAVKWVKKLHTEHGYTFTVISCLDTSLTARMFRKYNLEKVFGAECFNYIICLPCNGNKTSTLKKFPTGSWWIEDKPENAEIGRSLGMKSLLYTLDHNSKNKSSVPRVKAWREIYKIITSSQ